MLRPQPWTRVSGRLPRQLGRYCRDWETAEWSNFLARTSCSTKYNFWYFSTFSARSRKKNFGIHTRRYSAWYSRSAADNNFFFSWSGQFRNFWATTATNFLTFILWRFLWQIWSFSIFVNNRKNSELGSNRKILFCSDATRFRGYPIFSFKKLKSKKVFLINRLTAIVVFY